MDVLQIGGKLTKKSKMLLAGGDIVGNYECSKGKVGNCKLGIYKTWDLDDGKVVEKSYIEVLQEVKKSDEIEIFTCLMDLDTGEKLGQWEENEIIEELSS